MSCCFEKPLNNKYLLSRREVSALKSDFLASSMAGSNLTSIEIQRIVLPLTRQISTPVELQNSDEQAAPFMWLSQKAFFNLCWVMHYGGIMFLCHALTPCIHFWEHGTAHCVCIDADYALHSAGLVKQGLLSICFQYLINYSLYPVSFEVTTLLAHVLQK